MRRHLGTGNCSPVECIRSTKHSMHAGEHNTRDATTTSRSPLSLPPVPWCGAKHISEPLFEAFMVHGRAALGNSRSKVRDKVRKKSVARRENDQQVSSHDGLVIEGPNLECGQPRSCRDVRPA